MPVLRGAFYDPNTDPDEGSKERKKKKKEKDENGSSSLSLPDLSDDGDNDNRKWWQKLLGVGKVPPLQNEMQWKSKDIPPADWRPKTVKDRGKMFLDDYRDKLSDDRRMKRLRMMDKMKKIKAQKRKDIREKGRYNCTIRQCPARFFCKTEQIAHTTMHQDKLDYGFQRRILAETLWQTEAVKAINVNEEKYNDLNTVIDEIGEWVNPTEVWREKARQRPPIQTNPTCTCRCICGFQKYKDQKQQRIDEIRKMHKIHGLDCREAIAQVEAQYVPNEPVTKVVLGRVVDMISFNVDGPGVHNVKSRGEQYYDPLMVECICICYCGSVPFDEKDFIEAFIRYIDIETLHRSHTLDLHALFNLLSIKFPVEKYNRLRTPKDYAKYEYITKRKLKNDMLSFQKYPIKRSLTIIRKEDCRDADHFKYVQKMAPQLFKMICCFQGHCAYRDPKDVPYEIVQIGLKNEVLRDEIMLQIIKQTKGNPDERSCQRAWKLIYACLSAWTPSYEMGLTLLSHIAMYAKRNGIGTFDSVEDIARHCFYAWIPCMKGELQVVEKKDLWKLIMRKREKLIHITIHSWDGSYAELKVPNSWTVTETANCALKYFGLSRTLERRHWLIRGISNDTESNIKLFFSSPTLSLLHLTSRWNAEKQRNPKITDIKFVLYRRVWKSQDRKAERYNEKDPAFGRMIAKQCLHDFNHGIILTEPEVTIEICAHSVAIYHRAMALTVKNQSWHYISAFIPKWVRKQWDCAPWIEQIYQMANGMSFSQNEYLRAVLEESKKKENATRHWIREFDDDDFDSDSDELPFAHEKDVMKRWALHMEGIFKSLINILLKSDSFGLSTFCGYLIEIDTTHKGKSIKEEGILKVNEEIMVWTKMDHITVLDQYHFKDLLDLEVVHVQGAECLKFTIWASDVPIDQADVLWEAEEIVFQTDEAMYIADFIGNLQRETNDKFWILY